MRVSVTAVMTVVRMPRMKTTAKPRTGPEPSANSATAAISMVTLESMIVAKARWKPASKAETSDLPRCDSSRMRS